MKITSTSTRKSHILIQIMTFHRGWITKLIMPYKIFMNIEGNRTENTDRFC